MNKTKRNYFFIIICLSMVSLVTKKLCFIFWESTTNWRIAIFLMSSPWPFISRLAFKIKNSKTFWQYFNTEEKKNNQTIGSLSQDSFQIEEMAFHAPINLNKWEKEFWTAKSWEKRKVSYFKATSQILCFITAENLILGSICC